MDQLLKNRGPQSNCKIWCDDMLFQATVLWQQGLAPAIQPQESEEFVLLFNGDLYMDYGPGSDTEYIFKQINTYKTEDELIEFFKSINGPFSAIIYDKSKKKLYFLRDSLGRNTLLLGKTNDLLYLTSVVSGEVERNSVVEVPPLGIYSLHINDGDLALELYPWQKIEHDHHLEQLKCLKTFLEVEIEVKQELNPVWLPKELISKHNYNFKELVTKSQDPGEIFDSLLQIPEVLNSVNEFISLLTKSIQDRVINTPQLCRDCIKIQETFCPHPKVGILFSGGIDCSIITLLANSHIPENLPIDLLNVSFEKFSNKSEEKIDWNVPDRITALQTIQELRSLCPGRKFNLVKVNINRKELNHQLEHKIVHLVNPLVSVLDESLGGALWFAARGEGIVEDNPYKSSCRVLLIGSGADELFGGYSRHRNAHKRSTLDKDLLAEELHQDWMKLPGRNLARDDRIVGDHGVTLRAPFVQEDFVKFVQNLKPFQRCYHELEPGVGDKLLLRLVGYQLGLVKCCVEKKRALQFGSRIANKKQNAKDISSFCKKEK